MPKQYIKCFFRVYCSKCLYYFINIVYVSSKGHFESEAVCEGDALADGFEEICILGCDYGLGCQAQVPEFNEQGLQRLYFEYFGESHAGEGVIGVHLFYYIVSSDAMIVILDC